MKKGKIKLVLVSFVTIALIVTWLVWIYQAYRQGNLFETLAISAPFLIIIVVMLPFIVMLSKSVKNNLPVEDEMSIKAKVYAGYYTFLISIYYLLALGLFGDKYFTRPSQATGAAILGITVIFLLLLAYLNKKGASKY